jgi:hypothetical protein
MKTPIQHFDKLGRELVVGDVVAFKSFYTGMTIGRIDRLKKVRASIVSLSDARKSWYISGPEDINTGETVKLDPRDVAFYLLKNK